MSKLSIVALLGLSVSACSMGPEMSLLDVVEGPSQASVVLVEPAKSAQAVSPQSRGLVNDQERAETLAHLKALSLTGQRQPGGSLSSSVAELKRLQATHGKNALSEIEAEGGGGKLVGYAL